MGEFLQRYRDRVVEILDHAVTSQTAAFEAVRDAVATALAGDRLIYVAGRSLKAGVSRRI